MIPKLSAVSNICGSLVISFGMALGTSHASEYPDKPITLVVPYAPGGLTDSLGRQVSHFLSKRLNQAVPVENKPGGSSTLGGRYLANAKPDGYTIGVFDATGITVTPQLYKTPPYESLKAFQPVTRLGNNYQVIIANLDSSVNTLSDFISHAQSNPGTPVATPGAMGINIIELARLGKMANFDITNVGYNGSLPLLQDVMGGQVEFAFLDLATATNFIRTGKVKPIAVTSKTRVDLFPNVPTVAESGFPDYEALAWFGVLVPAATPKSVVDRLNDALQEFGSSKEYISWALDRSFFPAVSESPESFKNSLASEIEKYTSMSRLLNLSIN